MRVLLILPMLAIVGCGEAGDDRQDRAPRALPRAASASLPPGSVPQGYPSSEAELLTVSPRPTPALLAQGRQVWLGKCASCHGADGSGLGPVVQKGFPQPPPLHRGARPPRYVVAVVTNGWGQMPALGGQVPPLERWAVAHWLARTDGDAR